MKRIVFLLGLAFVLGWVSHSVYSNQGENPLMVGPRELISPSDIVKESQIKIYDDKIVIDIANARWSRYADTNSMDPVLDKGANGLQIIPKSEKDIHVGDIITYEPVWSDKLVVHRVVDIGRDDLGWYAIAKGDNTNRTDPGKIRFEQIRYLLIGVIY
jgi:hypothetical protein